MNTRRVVENFEVIVFPQIEKEWTQYEHHAVGAQSSQCMILFQMPRLGSWKCVDCNRPARTKNTSRITRFAMSSQLLCAWWQAERKAQHFSQRRLLCHLEWVPTDKPAGQFQAKRIRSGVETALASLRVSQEIKGHLLSHGTTGVQAASYDGHDYAPQKLEALETLHRFLTETSASVVHISARVAA